MDCRSKWKICNNQFKTWLLISKFCRKSSQPGVIGKRYLNFEFSIIISCPKQPKWKWQPQKSTRYTWKDSISEALTKIRIIWIPKWWNIPKCSITIKFHDYRIIYNCLLFWHKLSTVEKINSWEIFFRDDLLIFSESRVWWDHRDWCKKILLAQK